MTVLTAECRAHVCWKVKIQKRSGKVWSFSLAFGQSIPLLSSCSRACPCKLLRECAIQVVLNLGLGIKTSQHLFFEFQSRFIGRMKKIQGVCMCVCNKFHTKQRRPRSKMYSKFDSCVCLVLHFVANACSIHYVRQT